MQFNRLLKQIRRSEIDLLILHKLLATEDPGFYVAFANTTIAFAREMSKLSIIATHNLHCVEKNSRCIFKFDVDLEKVASEGAVTFFDLTDNTSSTYRQIISKQIEILMLIRDIAKESIEMCSALTGMSLSNARYITTLIPTDVLPLVSDTALFRLPFKNEKSLKDFLECARCQNTFQFALDMVA